MNRLKKVDDQITPVEVVYSLVQVGFSKHEVLYDLSYKQVNEFFRLFQKTQNEQMKRDSIATRVAQADKSDFEKFIKGK